MGSQDHVLSVGVRRLSADLQHWFEANDVPSDRRVALLSLKMLGDRKGCGVNDPANPHPGSNLKLKAAETGAVVPWAVDLLRRQGRNVPCLRELQTAGEALERWLEVTREAGDVLNFRESQELRDSCQRHLINCVRAGVHLVPKHHYFAHLSLEAPRLGNPKVYSCFLDESLNLTLRTFAEHAHRARQEVRIFFL